VPLFCIFGIDRESNYFCLGDATPCILNQRGQQGFITKVLGARVVENSDYFSGC
jgi:hypothetical protein